MPFSCRVGFSPRGRSLPHDSTKAHALAEIAFEARPFLLDAELRRTDDDPGVSLSCAPPAEPMSRMAKPVVGLQLSQSTNAPFVDAFSFKERCSSPWWRLQRRILCDAKTEVTKLEEIYA